MNPNTINWSHVVPQNIAWPNHLSNHPLPNNFVFSANHESNSEVNSPDPCTSQTLTQWELLNKHSTNRTNSYLKRRSSYEDDEDSLQPPTKQYISEEKFAHKFDQLHISNEQNYNIETCDNVLHDEVEIEETAPVLVVPAEVKKVVTTNDEILDKLVQNEVDKCSKAVILWQPSYLISSEILNSDNSKEKEVDNEFINDKFVEAVESDGEMMDL